MRMASMISSAPSVALERRRARTRRSATARRPARAARSTTSAPSAVRQESHRPPDRHGRGCRRSCRACAPRGRRCRGRPRGRKPPVGSGTRPSSIAAWVMQAPSSDGDRSSSTRGQLGDAGDVDQQPRLREAQIEHRPQRLAAGQHLGVGRRRRAGARPRRPIVGRAVVEGDGLHAAAFGRARARRSPRRCGAA